MRPDRVLFASSHPIAHPVLDRLFGGYIPSSPRERGDFSAYDLVVIDARQPGDALGEGGLAQRALEARVNVLVVAPNEGQMSSVTRIAGAGPRTPAQAVFIAPSRNGAPHREVKVLGYPVTLVADAKQEKPPKRRVPPAGETEVLGNFVSHIESRVTRGFQAVAGGYPDGLKRFITTWSHVSSVYYAAQTGEVNFGNSGGSLTIFLQIYVFLNETTSEQSTYVITEGSYELYPGVLDENDEEGRGVMNFWFKSGIRPDKVGIVSAGKHIPTNGTDAWTEDFTVDINYLEPFGGTGQYVFKAVVEQAIASWSVQNSSADALQGSTWFVNSPVNGLYFPEDYRGGFTGGGHVEPFPSACTATLLVKDASAWLYNGVISGVLGFETDSYFMGAALAATQCSAFFCYDAEHGVDNHRSYPWFEIYVSMI